MIDLRHPLAVLGRRMPWSQFEAALTPAFARKDGRGELVALDDLFGPTLAVAGAGVSAAGRPRLSIRLMASLLYLKHAFNLSDEALADRWAEKVVWQYFSGQEYCEPRRPCDATQIGRFRTAIGAAKRAGIALKQTFARDGKALRQRAGGYGHAKQFRRLRKVVNARARSWAPCCARSGASAHW